ncbi:hypothetical protein [Moraxella lacunata]|uniref:hypothetical protein n=1 Tax=Moraxella lacunata TaxID=477 RepID=UPI003EE22691
MLGYLSSFLEWGWCQLPSATSLTGTAVNAIKKSLCLGSFLYYNQGRLSSYHIKICRLPALSIGLTNPASSIMSTIRAARL